MKTFPLSFIANSTTVLLAGLTMGACTSPPDSSPSSCSPGSLSRSYVINELTLPQSNTDFAIDLNGDGKADNQYGNIVGAFTAQNIDQQATLNQSIASGSDILLIRQESSDPAFKQDLCAQSIVQQGHAIAMPNFSGTGIFKVDSANAPFNLSGALENSLFQGLGKDPTATETLTLNLMFVNQLVPVQLVGVHATYGVTDSGLTAGQIQGAIPVGQLAQIYSKVAEGMNAQIAANSTASSSKQSLQLFDNGGSANATCGTTCQNPNGLCAQANDGKIDICELATNSIVKNLFAPDVQMFDSTTGNFAPNAENTHKDSLSVAVGFTAVKAQF